MNAQPKPQLPDTGPPAEPLNYGGFRLWRIDPKNADQHPDGATYAGIVRLPDGRYFGINATISERKGQRYFEGGAYPCEPVPDLWPMQGHGTRVPNTGRIPQPNSDLVDRAEAIARDHAEFDDSDQLDEALTKPNDLAEEST